MARPKGRPSEQKRDESSPTPRVTIINLKGSDSQADWLEEIHRKTHIAKSVIVRLALAAWAKENGHDPFPVGDDDR